MCHTWLSDQSVSKMFHSIFNYRKIQKMFYCHETIEIFSINFLLTPRRTSHSWPRKVLRLKFRHSRAQIFNFLRPISARWWTLLMSEQIFSAEVEIFPWLSRFMWKIQHFCVTLTTAGGRCYFDERRGCLRALLTGDYHEKGYLIRRAQCDHFLFVNLPSRFLL